MKKTRRAVVSSLEENSLVILSLRLVVWKVKSLVVLSSRLIVEMVKSLTVFSPGSAVWKWS